MNTVRRALIWAIKYLNIATAIILLCAYMIFAGRNGYFPSEIYDRVVLTFEQTLETISPKYLRFKSVGPEIATHLPDEMQPGLVFISGVGVDRMNFLRVVQRDGAIIHEWKPDWFNLWPNAEDVLPFGQLHAQPGAAIHGAAIAPNGDVVFNFEHLSTLRLNACGEVVWKHMNFAHHSVYQTRDGSFVVPVSLILDEDHPRLPNVGPRYHDDGIQFITADGEIQETYHLLDILAESGLSGLIHLSSIDNDDTRVQGDLLHTNDIEVFEGPGEGYLAPGDVVVSLRNINTILVLEGDTLRAKGHFTGMFLRQHDPDILDANTLIVYDNNNRNNDVASATNFSVISRLDLSTGVATPVLGHTDSLRFYSEIMGKLDLLENGNLMIASSRQGWVFEATPQGELVWEYRNSTGRNKAGLVTQADILPSDMDAAFFGAARARCS